MIYILFNLKNININHLDIKPLNILLIKKWNNYIIKLSDFGESR